MEILEEVQIRPATPGRAIRRLLDGVRVFTVLAVVVALIGIGVSVTVNWRIGEAERGAQEQLRGLSRTTAQSAQTLRGVTDASTQGGTTVDSATMSLRQVSGTIRDTAGTIDATAGVFNFAIPITNAHPLAGVEQSFRQQADQLRTIATQIDQTNDALGKNGDSLRGIGQQVALVANNTDDLASQLKRFADGPGPNSVPAIAHDVRILLIWSVVLHVLILGFALSFYILTTALRQITYDIPRIVHRDDGGKHVNRMLPRGRPAEAAEKREEEEKRGSRH
ncbi:MAG: hypothetical protein LC748_06810 [Thermomicrobia bacterium]|nr:hypothetical protein [Thermomicrobia bacterium]